MTRARMWHDIAEPYRKEAWSECARLANAQLDQDPYDLSTRALLASLLLRSGQRTLALMHYERLLPLAVGRGDLFRALGTQRRLDDLHPADHRHPDRYRAIHDWFRALPASHRKRGGRGGRSGLAAVDLLDLPAEAFAVVTEQTQMSLLDMTPQVVHEPDGVLWAVYLGRVRWSIAGDGAAIATFAAEEGDVIHLPPGVPDTRRLELEAELPAEVIQFDPRLAELLERLRRTLTRGPADEAASPARPAAFPVSAPDASVAAAEPPADRPGDPPAVDPTR